jgi:hypothetical protein
MMNEHWWLKGLTSQKHLASKRGHRITNSSTLSAKSTGLATSQVKSHIELSSHEMCSEQIDKSPVVCRDRSVSRQANRFEVTSVEIEVCYADALRRSSDRLQLQK